MGGEPIASTLWYRRAEELTDTVLREGGNGMALVAFHGFRPEHRVHDGLFDGLHGGLKNTVEGVVREHRNLLQVLGRGGLGIPGGEGDEDVAGAVAGGRPG